VRGTWNQKRHHLFRKAESIEKRGQVRKKKKKIGKDLEKKRGNTIETLTRACVTERGEAKRTGKMDGKKREDEGEGQ